MEAVLPGTLISKKSGCALRTCKIFPSKDFESEKYKPFFSE